MIGEVKTGAFRLRTYSRDTLLSSKKPEGDVPDLLSKQVKINWASKDLKRQNEEIIKMLERTRKDPMPLQKVPRRLGAGSQNGGLAKLGS